MTVSLKIYVDFGSENQEIRRLSTDDRSWESIEQKLKQLFPRLNDVGFSVFWKDAEGDLVSISSDEEFDFAVQNSGEPTVKIYVKTVPKEDNEQQQGLFTVTCDGCKATITGPVFKCMICPDFDLCSSCEGQGLHSEHDMIRFRAPDLHSRLGFMRGRGRCRGGWNMNRGRGCGGRGMGWRGGARGRPHGPCGIRGEFTIGGFGDGMPPMPGFPHHPPPPPFHPFFHAWFSPPETGEEEAPENKTAEDNRAPERDEDLARVLSQMEAIHGIP